MTPFQPYSGEVVLPSSTVPASRSRCDTGASTVHGPFSSVARLPMRVGRPLVSTMSLMVIGTPSMSLSRLPPFFQRFSEARAASQRAVGIEMLEGVELRVEGLDPGERGLHRLDRRGLARLVQFHQLMRGHHREIGSHCLVSGSTGNLSGWASA